MHSLLGDSVVWTGGREHDSGDLCAPERVAQVARARAREDDVGFFGGGRCVPLLVVPVAFCYIALPVVVLLLL